MSPQPVRLPALSRPNSPLVVFSACYLLAGVAAVRTVAAIADFYALPEVARAYSLLVDDQVAGQTEALILALLALVSLLVAAVFLVLAILDGLGMNPARIVTWVVGGLTIAVSAVNLATSQDRGVPWHHRMTIGLTLITLVFVVASIVLLTLPAAHRFYRAALQYRIARRPLLRPMAQRPPYPVPGFPPRPWPPQHLPRPPSAGGQATPGLPPGPWPPPPSGGTDY
jgi:hypothetical protein